MTDTASDNLEHVELNVEQKTLHLYGYPGEHIFSRIKARKEPYEYDLLQFMHQILGEGLVIDVGANLGNHSIYFASVMGRRVVAIEPEPGNLAALRRNVDANGLGDQVAIHAVAAWNEAGRIELEQQIEGNRGTFAGHEAAAGSIPAERLDSLIGDATVGLIKIDVEGAELRVIEGARGILERSRPILVVESHGPETTAALTALLAPLGYRPCAVLGLSDNYVWASPPDAADDIRQLFMIADARRFQRQVAHTSDVQGRRLLAAGEQLSGMAEAVSAASAEEKVSSRSVTDAIERVAGELRASLGSVGELDLSRIIGRLDGLAAQLLASDVERRSADRHAHNLAARGRETMEAIEARLGDVLTELRMNGEASSTLVERVRTAIDDLLHSHLSPAEEPALEVVRRERDRLARAYARLSERYARLHPSEWSSRPALRGVLGSAEAELTDALLHEVKVPAQGGPRLDADGPRELVPHWRRRDRVRIGIASMPGREAALSRVLRILSPQADEIFVYLNGMESVPAEIEPQANVRFFTGPDLGDRGKFSFLEDFDGYFVTCDDDIEYARYHVSSIIDGIERYGRRAIVGWHGSIFTDEFEHFYQPASRKVLSFRFLRGKDTVVHLLGTGVCGFHTDTVRPSFSEFVYPNMADAFLAIHAQRRRVPMVVLAHQGGEAMPIETPGSISAASLGKDERGKAVFDVAGTVTQLIKDEEPWQTFPAEPAFVRPRVEAAIVGRVDRDRWMKGGILKSCHLTREMLVSYGWDVHMADIETGDPIGLGGRKPDIVIVYVGDPERPDFAQVVEIVEHHARRGSCVLVNLSDNGRSSRHEAILDRIQLWGREFGGRVRLMAFAAEAGRRPGIEQLSRAGLVVPIPKTLVYEDTGTANFHRSSSIFVGDIAKLSDESLIGGDGREWVAAIRRAVPEAKIVGVRQYRPRYDVDLGLDEVWPFLKGSDLAEKLRDVRVAVSAVKFATFEMVPVEVAALGIPTFYRAMPHSLSAYLGQAGIEVESPLELERRIPTVYRDPLVWRGYSEAGRLRATSAEFQSASASMIVQLSAFVEEMR